MSHCSWGQPGPQIKWCLPSAPNKLCGHCLHYNDRGSLRGTPFSGISRLPVSLCWEAMSINSSYDQQRAAAAWGRPRGPEAQRPRPRAEAGVSTLRAPFPPQPEQTHKEEGEQASWGGTPLLHFQQPHSISSQASP